MAFGNKNNQRKAVSGSGRDRLSATLALDAPVSSLGEVGPKRAEALGDLGIVSIGDLLEHYPRRYVDMSTVVTVAQARIGDQVTIVGQVHDLKQKNLRQKRLTLVEIGIVDQTGILSVTCFNQPWLASRLQAGDRISVSGKVEFNYGFKRMTNPHLAVLEPDERADGIIIPIHPSSARVSRPMMNRLVGEALSVVEGCYDPLPATLRAKYRLCSRYQAWRAIHQPETMADVAMARRRLIYEELLMVELGLMRRSRARMAQVEPFSHRMDGPGVLALADVMPFALSDEQSQAVGEILTEMARRRCMEHLLLGDVGTGKTAVATYALVAAADSGHQALMMGPTEVLVRQYERSVGTFLDALSITWATLTGSTDAHEREAILRGARDGSIQVLFGTHALLEDAVVMHECSLVVIDEQQRFGVDQRAALVAKGKGCDVLSLTATPIPRSLALALYGEMTLSYLRTRPAARAPRTTKVCHFEQEGNAYDAIRQALARGEQAYIICPLIGMGTDELSSGIDDDDADEEGGESQVEYAYVEMALETDSLAKGDTVLKAASTHARILGESVFPEAKVGLLHGKLSSAEKAEMMRAFSEGDVDILVSTTVVEVGVDVPNATVMVIEDADRFGLAQLHQLRGRVGRGEKPGYVYLVSRSKAPSALERLAALEQTDDGFALSERDLSMRREGDIFGGKQHGASNLKLVNVVRDAAVIEAARADALAILDEGLLDEAETSIIERAFARLED